MKKMKRTFALLAVVVATACGCTTPHCAVQSEAELQDIVGHGSYPWVLVQVSVTGTPPEVVCMQDDRLLLSLLVEHELNGKTDDVLWQTVSNAIHVGATSGFRFTKPEVRDLIPKPCSPEALDYMRKSLSAYSNRQLLKHDFASTPLDLDIHLHDTPEENRRVFAQVLIERGLRPFRGCFDGVLYIRKAKLRHNTVPADTTRKFADPLR